MKRNEVIAALAAQGLSKKNVVVKSAYDNSESDNAFVTMTTEDVVRTTERDENEAVQFADGNAFSASLYSIASALREDEDVSPVVSHIVENPKSLRILLAGATVSIIQQEVPEGEVYLNPWSDDAEEQTFDHNVVINHIVGIKFTKKAMERIDKIVDKMLGL